MNNAFSDALADIHSMGLLVSEKPLPGAHVQVYGVIGGRSNPRWWLIPLHNGRVAASGLALFQPILPGARLIKWGAGILSLLGLSRLWARQKLYMKGDSPLHQYFPEVKCLSYAYFTGTYSPHRKMAVQIMDNKGGIKGFAKIGRNMQVAALLRHEAEMLGRVRSLKLQHGYIPSVLFVGETGAAVFLVTDTMKCPSTCTVTRFTDSHRAFLQDLFEKTALPAQPVTAIAARFAARIEALRAELDASWRMRLDNTLAAIVSQKKQEIVLSLSHGDFTPWNTFFAQGKLYVFDWEYAEDSTPPSNDIIHFTLNESRVRNRRLDVKLDSAFARLAEPWTGIKNESLPILMIIYCLTQVLRQVERLPNELRKQNRWDGAREQAEMLDILMERARP